MTNDDDKKLVEMLRDDHQYILVEGHNVTDWDSIEAQRFEAADRIEDLIAENERLREALRQIANIIPPIQTTIARAALGDTK
jgi:uncharacterized protein YeeX (DUF496 family)